MKLAYQLFTLLMLWVVFWFGWFIANRQNEKQPKPDTLAKLEYITFTNGVYSGQQEIIWKAMTETNYNGHQYYRVECWYHKHGCPCERGKERGNE